MYSGHSVPTFRDNLSVPSSEVKKPNFCLDFLTLEYGTDTLFRNVALELPLYAAKYTTRRQILSTTRQKPDTTTVLCVLRTAKITQRWRQILERLLSTGGMILTREYVSTERKTCPFTALYTTNPKQTGLALNPGLRAAVTATNLLNHKESFNIP